MFTKRIKKDYAFDSRLMPFVNAFESNCHPMGMLQTLVACLSSLHPESNPAYFGGQFGYKCQEERDTHIHRMLGCAPSIAAACYRRFLNLEIVPPSTELGYVENFLRMILGPDNPLAKNPVIVDAFEKLFILHAEHELNCSTAAIRHMTSALADVYTSLGGAITALYGPRHGGANEAVLKMLSEIGTVENIPNFVEAVKQKKTLLFGFGHRVYKYYDPRAKLVKNIA